MRSRSVRSPRLTRCRIAELETPAALASSSFSCSRSIRDLKTDMKEITVTSTWRGYDGRAHSASLITRYSKSGLYDYFYTSH